MTPESRETLEVLRSALADKMLGNELRCNSAALSSEVMDKTIELLAQSLSEAALRRGMVLVPGSSRAVAARDHWLSDQIVVAGKVRAVVSESPNSFLCMAAFQIEEEREQTKRQTIAADEWRGRYLALIEQIATAPSLKAVRQYIRRRGDTEED